jgi:hypothetical protein
LRAGQHAKGRGEPAVGVGVAPRVRLSEHGSDGLVHIVILHSCRPARRSCSAGRKRAKLTCGNPPLRARTADARLSGCADGRPEGSEDPEVQVEAGERPATAAATSIARSMSP